MILERLRHDASGRWDDAHDDDLPARIESLVATDAAAIEAAVEARRAIILAAYRAGTPARAGASDGTARRSPGLRRWAFALVTAVLTLGLAVAGVAASAAGGPLYGVRLATEEAFLPAEGEDRLAAQLERLDRRLGEAEAASSSGNRAGLEAALGAYRGIVLEVEVAHPESVDLPTQTRLRFQDRLAEQVRRLERLRDADPAAISITIDAGRRLGEQVGEPKGPGPDGRDGDVDGPDGEANPGAPGPPTATPAPSASPGGNGPSDGGASGGAHGSSDDGGCAGTPPCRDGGGEPDAGPR